MSKEYIYHNFIWKNIYGAINNNSIYSRFKKGEQFTHGFNELVSDTVSLANYTIKNSETKLYLSIKDKEGYFEFNSNWVATKIKGSFLLSVYDEVINQNKLENEYINWRSNLFEYMLNLKEKIKDFELSIDEDYMVELQFKVDLANLQDTFEPLQLLDNKLIIELAQKSSKEVFKIGIEYLDVDDKKCVGILKTILEEIPYSGLIIGIAYFNLGKSELSYQFILNSLNEITENFELDEELEVIIAEIIATNELNLGIADDRTIRTFFNVLNINQSPSALIKISYLILSRNIKHLKNFALENVNITTEFCLNDEDAFSKSAGFHIICSTLLWNNKFDEAEKYHHFFLLEDSTFFKLHNEQVESYIKLTLAKNDINFISNLFLDFPHIKNLFSGLFVAWNFDYNDSVNKVWSNLNLYNFRKIIYTREQYCD